MVCLYGGTSTGHDGRVGGRVGLAVCAAGGVACSLWDGGVVHTGIGLGHITANTLGGYSACLSSRNITAFKLL